MRKSILILLTVALGCAEQHTQQESPSVRDSAGIEIVESFQPAWTPGEQWQIGVLPVPVMKASDTETAAVFSRVLDVVRLADGTTVVGDAGRGSVEFFPANGRYLRSQDRRGSDTARFSRLSSLQMVAPERLLAFDAGNRRVTLFNDQGEILREVELEQVGASPPFHVFPVRGPSFFVVTGGAPAVGGSPASPLARDPTPLLLHTLDGTLRDTVTVARGGEYHSQIQGGRLMRGLVVFGHHTVATARGDRILIGTGDLFELKEYGSDGELRRIIRLPDLDLTLLQREIDAERAAWFEAASSMPPMRAAAERAPVGAQRPAYLDAEIDSEGNLWVAEYRTLPALGDPLKWYVFDGDGRWLGVVQAPRGFRIMDIGSDFVVGRYRGGGGDEEVSLHLLIKPLRGH